MTRNLLLLTLIIILHSTGLHAQYFLAPHIGFQSSGIKGTYQLKTQAYGTQTGNGIDVRKTAFCLGLQAGYQVFPENFADGWYKLDFTLDASYASYTYFEDAYNDQFGAGNFGTDGLSDGSTMVVAVDIMPMHRLTMPNFTLLSPYAGIGLGLHIFNTEDISMEPPNGPGTITGASEFKTGLLVFYGCTIQATEMIQPFLQFKHYLPFGSETQFTEDVQGQIVPGGGSTKYKTSILDVPGYFAITAGVRFTFAN